MNKERADRVTQKQANFKMIKEWDVHNKRMIEKAPECFVDLLRAEFIKIDNDTRQLTCRALGYEEYAIYDNGEIIGYLKPAIKKQIVISVRKSGILFQAFIKYSKIKCYAKS
jgi:hypothetical protein